MNPITCPLAGRGIPEHNLPEQVWDLTWEATYLLYLLPSEFESQQSFAKDP